MDADAALDQPITLVAIGGDPAAPFVPPRSLPACSVVVAADSGLDHLVHHGIAAHHVVGDLDSVAAARSSGLARWRGSTRTPSDKDATDLELALDLVLALVAGGARPDSWWSAPALVGSTCCSATRCSSARPSSPPSRCRLASVRRC
ncbi:MAG: hypothetical protein R2701_11410 [Acidimicrobiales bacterium]